MEIDEHSSAVVVVIHVPLVQGCVTDVRLLVC